MLIEFLQINLEANKFEEILKNTSLKAKPSLQTTKKALNFFKAFYSGWLTGFEPATRGTTNRYSNQLSYNHHFA
jgi:hypothetical protein